MRSPEPLDGLEALHRDDLMNLQSRAFTGLVAGLSRRSPFYRRLLEGVDAIGGDVVESRSSLPTTTRADLLSAQVADPPWGGLMAVDTRECSLFGFTNAITAGLPGFEPLRLAVTAEDMRTRVEVAARGMASGGAGPGDRTAIIGEVARSVLHHVLLGALARTGSTPFQTGRGLTLRHVRHTLPSLSPSQLVTHPTYAIYVARLLEEEGTALPVERLFLWGEMGPSVPTVRATLEKAWGGAQVRDLYASEELGVLAAECEASNGLHGFEDRFLYEVVDPETDQAIGPGRPGELVVSTLHAEAMPILRYRTGDLVMTDDASCPCGRTHLRIHVKGRVIRMPDGTARTFDLSNVERLLGRFPALWGLYRIVVEEDRAMLEVPLAALDEDQQAVAINTALLAARSAGIDLRPVEALPPFFHRATRVVRVGDIDRWEATAEEQRGLEL
jgi:phenylacetate-CoA ligase